MRSRHSKSIRQSRRRSAASLLSPVILLAGCADTVVSTPPAACASLIPQSWRTPVPPEPIPTPVDAGGWLGKPLTDAMVAAIEAPWATGFVGQAGALEKQAGRTVDAVDLMTRCEALVNQSRAR